jgi:hypothetical protein
VDKNGIGTEGSVALTDEGRVVGLLCPGQAAPPRLGADLFEVGEGGEGLMATLLGLEGIPDIAAGRSPCRSPRRLRGRGDNGTVRKHLPDLGAVGPDALRLYCERGLRSIPLGLERGGLSPERAAKMRGLLLHTLRECNPRSEPT